MLKIRNAFNMAAQAVKDTINGYDHKSFFGILHIGASGFMAYQSALWLTAGTAAIATAPVSFGVTALFTAANFGFAWHNGRQLRRAGHPPRYIK